MITLPANFEADVQGQNLNLYPVVIIDIDKTATNPDLHLSTKDVKLGSRHFKPLLLNIPSVKESMDFENRNYKISNVTLKISNYEYAGERFSDYPNNLQGTMGEDFPGSLINVAVKIYWVSQSYPSNHTIGFDNDGDEFALQVYKGFIRRYSHDEKTVTLSLEDASQKDLHRDVPVARLGDGVEVLPKFKNVPVPMVYGHVDKSPCVIKSTMADEDEDYYLIKIASDSKGNQYLGSDVQIGSQTITQSALYFFKNETYYNCSQNMFDDPETIDEDESLIENFTYDQDLGEINFNYPEEGENLTQINALGVFLIREPSHVKTYTSTSFMQDFSSPPFFNGIDGGVEEDFPEGTSNAIDGNENTFCLIKSDEFYTGRAFHGLPPHGSAAQLDISIEPISGLDPAKETNEAGDEVESTVDTYLLAKIENTVQPSGTNGFVAWSINRSGTNSAFNTQTYFQDITTQGIIPNSSGQSGYRCQDNYNSIDGEQEPFRIPDFINADTWSAIRIGIPGHKGVDEDNESIDFSVYTKIYYVSIYQKFKVDGIVDKTYYANVNGRTDLDGVYDS